MAEVIFSAPMELKAGVTGAELEKFWQEEYLPNVSELPGYKVTLFKGVFGKRAEQYLYVGHFESNERRFEIFPVEGQATPSVEMQQWMAANPAWEKLSSFFDESWYAEFTNYIALD